VGLFPSPEAVAKGQTPTPSFPRRRLSQKANVLKPVIPACFWRESSLFISRSAIIICRALHEKVALDSRLRGNDDGMGYRFFKLINREHLALLWQITVNNDNRALFDA
jgi:hypothetical protein